MKFQTVDLKIIPTNGGDVMHALKVSEKSFKDFGELYFSCVMPKSIKAWKKHKHMTMNLIVPCGLVKFVLLDEDNPLKFNEVIIGKSKKDRNLYKRLTIEPNTWFGFQGISKFESLVVNLADIEHTSSEVERKEIDSIPYLW